MSVSSLASAVYDDRTSAPARPRPIVIVLPTDSQKLAATTETRSRLFEKIGVDLAASKDGQQALTDLIEAATADEGGEEEAGEQESTAKTGPQQLAAALGVLVMWIPTEIVAAYAAFVLMTQPATGDPSYSLPIWLIALAATPLFIFVAAWAKKSRDKAWTDAEKRRLGWSVLLSPVAFALWSASIPASAWNLIDAFKADSAVFLLALLLAAGLFTLVAAKLTETTPKKLDEKAAKQKNKGGHVTP